MRRYISILCFLALLMGGPAAFGDDGQRLLSVDHYVRVKSTAPAIAGQDALIYVREVVLAGTRLTCPTRITAGWLIWRRRDSMCSRWT